MSQDEARVPMVPTLTAPLGGKGHRPVVGTRDCKRLLDVFAVVNLVTAALHTNILESRQDAKKKTGLSKRRRMQATFATHLRHVGPMYPASRYPRVVMLIDNAPWHAGEPVRQALADCPHRELKRLPSSSPQLNPIERFWKLLRRRATHNRLFDTTADLRQSLRNSRSYFQTVRQRLLTLVNRPAKKRKVSAGL